MTVIRPTLPAGLLAGGLLATVLAVGGTAAAVTGGQPIWRQAVGGVAIDGLSLRPYHDGKVLTLDQLSALQDRDLAMSSVTNDETACHGVSLYFDSDAEADRYVADFHARDEAARSRDLDDRQPPAAASDPCRHWHAPPPGMSHSVTAVPD